MTDKSLVKAVGEEAARYLMGKLRSVEGFPRPRVVFRDIMPLIADAKAYRILLDALQSTLPVSASDFDYVGGLEARGFLIGAPLADRLGKGFVPFRKNGKLPPPVLREDYQLEYGISSVEVEKNLIKPNSRVLIVDDLMATGGTAVSAARLVKRSRAKVAGFCFLIELKGQGGRERLSQIPISTLIQFPERA
ncbi:MAG: adenine phosphoribosyltransferase [Aeriscardovia sp.]|nr:adenine phosphoribosyltransferase [Aeriscardovia sp.]MBO7717797.1 adenine phosphoribosyltransferase [Aeriscardovia sp.]